MTVDFFIGKKWKTGYSARKASMGFNCAALYAGRSQNTMPIITEQPNDNATEYGVMKAEIEKSEASLTMP